MTVKLNKSQLSKKSRKFKLCNRSLLKHQLQLPKFKWIILSVLIASLSLTLSTISQTFSHQIHQPITTTMVSLTSKAQHHSKCSNNSNRTSLMILFLTCQICMLKEELTLAITNSLLSTPWTSETLINNKMLLCPWLSNSSSKIICKVASSLWHSLRCNSSSNYNNNSSRIFSTTRVIKISSSSSSRWCNNSSSSRLCSPITYQTCNSPSSCNPRAILKEITHNLINNNSSSKSTSRVPWKTTDKPRLLMVALTISRLLSSQQLMLIKTYMVAL